MFKLLGSTQNMGVTWAQTVMSGFPKEGACDKSHCIKTTQVTSVFRRSTLDLLYILFQLLPIFPVCRESFLECSIHCSSFPRLRQSPESTLRKSSVTSLVSKPVDAVSVSSNSAFQQHWTPLSTIFFLKHSLYMYSCICLDEKGHLSLSKVTSVEHNKLSTKGVVSAFKGLSFILTKDMHTGELYSCHLSSYSYQR